MRERYHETVERLDAVASLRALLTNLIDYAGLYPPAALPLDQVTANYERYLATPESWMLNRLVVPAARLGEIHPRPGWRITLLADEDAPALPAAVETNETKSANKFSRPVYRELPLSAIDDGYAKVRTGALTPDGIPSASELADFLLEATARRLPFKATAGLHHPIRAERALTYAPDSPCAMMHGFVNVFSAAAFAWHGADRALILDLLNETEARSFAFADVGFRWHGHSLSTEQLASTRREFAHSFGSCSFEDPVADLRALGWLHND
jgi:hypothetical protein